MRFKPVDCVYYKFGNSNPLQKCRVAVVCQATEQVLAENDDGWMVKIGKEENVHFQEFLDWSELATKQNSLKYSSTRNNLVMRGNTGAVDLHQTVKSIEEAQVSNEENQVFLKLDAVF